MTDSSATKILLVEDDEVAAAFAQKVLQGAGFEVIIAADGRAGLDIAAMTRASPSSFWTSGFPTSLGTTCLLA